MLQATDIQKSFGSTQVLRGVSLRIARGEVVVVDEDYGLRITEIVEPGAED